MPGYSQEIMNTIIYILLRITNDILIVFKPTHAIRIAATDNYLKRAFTKKCLFDRIL